MVVISYCVLMCRGDGSRDEGGLSGRGRWDWGFILVSEVEYLQIRNITAKDLICISILFKY